MNDVWVPIMTAVIVAGLSPAAYRWVNKTKLEAETGDLIDQRWSRLNGALEETVRKLTEQMSALEDELAAVRTELHTVRRSWSHWGLIMVGLLRKHAPGVDFPPPPESFDPGSNNA